MKGGGGGGGKYGYLLVERGAVGDYLRLPHPRGQIQGDIPLPERRSFHNQALMQGVSFCRVAEIYQVQPIGGRRHLKHYMLTELSHPVSSFS
jgi:hypothetical protein